jgi:hypothetical protein
MPDLPTKFFPWPEDAENLRQGQVVDLYERGAIAAFKEPEIDEQLLSELRWKDFAAAASEFGLEESGKGKLSLPYACCLRLEPDSLPGPPQPTGDCVSRGTANACWGTMACEIIAGKPDPITGKVEGYPGVPQPNQQVIATEPIYGMRGHGGQGASCSRLAKAVSDWGGILLRQPYPELDIDLTKYQAMIGHRWGGRGGTPKKILEEGKKHQIRTVTYIRDIEQARDALANGYCLNCCSGLGFSNTRNEHGVSGRRGSWAHAMAWMGVDDTPWAHKHYGGPLFLILNSWARWNRGPRRHNQPHGSFWVTHKDAASIIRAGGSFAFSGFNGFPAQEIDWTGVWNDWSNA